MTAVGLATVLSAEVGQVVFSLTLATLGTSRSSRRLLYGSMDIATIVALDLTDHMMFIGERMLPFDQSECLPAFPRGPTDNPQPL